ncbi:DUF2892 domain-containing protein [Leptospira wolffii]|uniref:Inner membrane protein YgaP-like transmembrane domain-containing protein n=1 Tax=Leptospira wolffii TaxID=409998 RepID=A0A2M9Z8C0_9LEPT|nr:DUF2892 domain-containing protein [Leptospira wolffii]PJZ64668.1 hypothetical protein CH371_16200 [Leptospira wolffii]TGK55900.1 DUF2892 domain-containing protein [Leptospira wolffii]TGK75769.1 DUF2892 domain-containing protein [Leptospira wolffii]TGK75891.1 DUF2892 domain-containing protein [Leptospira wolffii]TGL27523.1 DUF2892 domain-containing protein [Leptospira wolffii]
MKMNEGNLDRTIRTIVGIGLIAFGVSLQGPIGTGLVIFGLVPLLTGLLGYCPLYSLFGWNSCPVKK